MERTVEVHGTRDSLINVLSQAQNELQNQDSCELTIRSENENTPDLRLSFTREDNAIDESNSPWISRFDSDQAEPVS